MAVAFSLGGSLLEEEDVLRAVLQEADATALRQLKAASVVWCAHARHELCNRLWVRLSRREGQPEPAGVDSITDLDVECLNEAGRPWEVVVAGRQLPQLARLHGYGFVVDVQAVREADLEEADLEEEDDDAPLGGVALRSCIQGEGQPPNELLLAAVACAASGTVRGVPVQRLREDDAIGGWDLSGSGIGVTGATLLGLMLPAATFLRILNVDGSALQIDRLKGTKPTKKIDLSRRGLGVASAIIIASCIKGNGVLKELNLWANKIGDKGASVIAAVLKETIISELNLAYNQICDLHTTKLCEGLKGSTVTSLNIGNNRIGAEGAAALAAVLKETMISYLNLGNTQLCGVDHWGDGTYTTEGITKLCDGLKGSAVTSIDLDYNQLGPEGGAAIADGLKGNSTLQLLRIDTGMFSDRYVGLPIDKLKGTKPTKKIDLSVKRLGVASAIIIASCIKENGVLKELNLDRNQIGDEGALALAAILKETKITKLSLRSNDIRSDQARQAVRDAAGSGVRIEF